MISRRPSSWAGRKNKIAWRRWKSTTNCPWQRIGRLTQSKYLTRPRFWALLSAICSFHPFFAFFGRPVNLYEQQQNNTDFFANDFGGPSNRNNNNTNNNGNFDAFSSINDFGNDNAAYLQQQQTGFNNPYLQFQQQQQLAQQQAQQLLMQQQFAQQQAQQQQQLAFMNMNNPYQQQMMPQMTGSPAIGSNNPFSAFAQKPAMTGMNSFNSGAGLNGLNNSNTNNNSANNPLGELAFLQNAMTPTTNQPVSLHCPYILSLAFVQLEHVELTTSLFCHFFSRLLPSRPPTQTTRNTPTLLWRFQTATMEWIPLATQDSFESQRKLHVDVT